MKFVGKTVQTVALLAAVSAAVFLAGCANAGSRTWPRPARSIWFPASS